MKDKYKCCENPDHYLCYIPCYPFKGRYCDTCGGVIMDCGWFAWILWKYFFSYLWNGTVKVVIPAENAE